MNVVLQIGLVVEEENSFLLNLALLNLIVDFYTKFMRAREKAHSVQIQLN